MYYCAAEAYNKRGSKYKVKVIDDCKDFQCHPIVKTSMARGVHWLMTSRKKSKSERVTLKMNTFTLLVPIG